VVGQPWGPSPSGANRTKTSHRLAKRCAQPRTSIHSGGPVDDQLGSSPLGGDGHHLSASPDGPLTDSVALAFQMRAIPKSALDTRIRSLNETELAELELATDEALGRVEPD
jgi:hypothetical protein